MAQDKPTLKDVLGKVQSESETKAVEDLVDKLKGSCPQAGGAPRPQRRRTRRAAAPRQPAAVTAASGDACRRAARRWPPRRRPRHPTPSPS